MECNIESKCDDCVYYRFKMFDDGDGGISYVDWCLMDNVPNIDGCKEYKQ